VIEELLFDVSEALLVPVLVLTVAALALVLVEAGSLLVEVRRRRGRNLWALERAVEQCRGRLAAGMPAEALAALLPFAWNQRMEDALAGVVEQWAGDPLDGLVNLFDLGIVLSVAFLLAALSSLDLASALTGKAETDARTRPADAVVAEQDQKVKQVELKPGEKVVGRGEPIGTVYRLSDGRTVVVREPR
jgi:hypothetical protein